MIEGYLDIPPDYTGDVNNLIGSPLLDSGPTGFWFYLNSPLFDSGGNILIASGDSIDGSLKIGTPTPEPNYSVLLMLLAFAIHCVVVSQSRTPAVAPIRCTASAPTALAKRAASSTERPRSSAAMKPPHCPDPAADTLCNAKLSDSQAWGALLVDGGLIAATPMARNCRTTFQPLIRRRPFHAVDH
jgi:hypothetical protein